MSRRRFMLRAAQLGLRRAWSLAGAITVLVGGSILAAVTAVADLGIVPTLVALALLGLLVLGEGGYLAWREQRATANGLRPSNRREELGPFYARGSELTTRAITNDDEFAAWRADLQTWSNDTHVALARASPADAARFRNPGPIMSAATIGAYSREYTAARLQLDNRLEFLGATIDRLR